MRALITCNQKIEMVKIIMMITLTDVCNSLIFPVSAYVISLLMFFSRFYTSPLFSKVAFFCFMKFKYISKRLFEVSVRISWMRTINIYIQYHYLILIFNNAGQGGPTQTI